MYDVVFVVSNNFLAQAVIIVYNSVYYCVMRKFVLMDYMRHNSLLLTIIPIKSIIYLYRTTENWNAS